MTKDIFVFIETRNNIIAEVSLQLLSEARKLKAQYIQKGMNHDVVAVLPGYQVENLTSVLFNYGADKVILCQHEKLKEATTQHTSKALSDIIRAFAPDSFLIGATVIGRDIAPRVAARVDTGLTADATIIEVDMTSDTSLLLVTRPAFGGNLFGTIVCPNFRPQMATIRPNVFEKTEIEAQAGEVVVFETTFDEVDWVEILKREVQQAKTNDIAKARIIVSAGRSMAKHLDLIRDFAQVLNAEVGASRGLVETGIVGKDVQVGQTGKTVRPLVYIACGISGAVQHTAGMDKAECIIAINSDPNAAIFQIAHVGIVGDAVLILPKLKEELQKVLHMS